MKIQTPKDRLYPLFAALLVLMSALTARAALEFPWIIGNNMVLQRDKPVPIWGWDDPGQEVTVALGEARATATAGKNGKWLVTLPAQKTGGPHTITITGSSKVELENILFGEVWICSGQSNMGWPLHRCLPNTGEGIPGADLPGMRSVRLPNVMAAKPLGDDRAATGLGVYGKQAEIRKTPLMPRPPDRAATLKAEGAGWQVCSEATARHLTGVIYFFGRELSKELGMPIGLINVSWGGSKIEPWIPPSGYESVRALKENADTLAQRLAKPFNHTAPTVMYNGMIHPLLPCAIRGVIWYQGESNGNEGESYTLKMEALVNGWRKEWKQGDFPFYFVQLPNYVAHGGGAHPPDSDPKGGNGWARIREAQSKVPARVKNTGMAVTIDVGESNNIHPANKYDVGRRLALLALANDYGKKDLVQSGPVFKSMKVAGTRIELSFDHAGGGLLAARKSGIRSREEAKPSESLDGLAVAGVNPEMPKPVDKVDGFAIAGADRKWHWAEAALVDGKVIVSSPAVEKPVAVRYGFSANPGRCNLYNREGLPAAPFRTDDWKFLRYTDHTLGRIVAE